MKSPDYVPDSGHVVRLELAGRVLALVLSPASYNSKTGLMICCPISPTVKGHPFEVPLESAGLAYAVLCDHVKSLDWIIWNAHQIDQASPVVMAHARAKIKALLEIA